MSETSYTPYPPAAGTQPLTPQPPPVPAQLWPVDNKRFRNDFPEFADPGAYTDSTLSYWLTVAQMLNNPCVWGTLLPTAIELLAAHYMVQEAQALKIANAGGIPGIQSGMVQSKAVSAVSISYAVQGALEDGAGSYNATIYGQRWWHLAQLVGAGAIQL
jgi:hypothetical protein